MVGVGVGVRTRRRHRRRGLWVRGRGGVKGGKSRVGVTAAGKGAAQVGVTLGGTR